MKKIVIIVIIFICLLFVYPLNGDNSYPPVWFILDGSVDPYFPYKNIDTKNWEKSKRDVDKRTEIENKLMQSYKEMWEDFKNNGENSLPYCIFDAFNKFKEQKATVFITFSLTSWWNAKTMDFPTGDQSCFTAAAEYFPDDPKANPTIYRGLYIFCIWEKFYDGKICTKALLFHELLHYALDQVRRNAEYVKEKNEFSVKIFIAPDTNLNNLYSDEAVVEDCELKLFGCGPDGYKHAEKKYKENGARFFNPSENDDCKLCELCKNK